MTRRRVGLGLLTIVLVGVVIVVALREAGDFERISGITPRDEASAEPTLRGTGLDTPSAEETTVVGRETQPGDRRSGTWTVTVRVIDLDGRPVAGATGRASDPDGRRTFTTDPAGVASVRTRQPQVGLRLDDDWSAVVLAMRLRAEVTLVQMRPMPLAVRVVDEDDRAVEGVRVRARFCWSSPYAPLAGYGASGRQTEQIIGTTDQTGRCTADLPVTTDWLELTAKTPRGLADARVGFPFEREVTLRLGSRRRIACVIVDETGRRLPSQGDLVASPLDRARAVVRLRDHRWWVEEELLDFVETDGETPEEPVERVPPPVVLAVPDAGPWHVHFEPDDPAWSDSDPVLVTAPAEEVRLVCRPAVTLVGRVEGAQDTTFRVRWIRALTETGGRPRGCAAPTGGDGAFGFGGIAPGPGTLFATSASDDRYALLENVEAPLEGVRLRPVEGFAIEGRIVDYEAPEGIPGATLSVLASNGTLQNLATVRTAGPIPDAGGESGTFRIPALPPGRYELRWQWRATWCGSSGRYRPFGVTVEVGPETQPVVLPCPP